jgi:hypothetical protein
VLACWQCPLLCQLAVQVLPALLVVVVVLNSLLLLASLKGLLPVVSVGVLVGLLVLVARLQPQPGAAAAAAAAEQLVGVPAVCRACPAELELALLLQL